MKKVMKRLGMLAIAANMLLVLNLSALAQVQTFNNAPKGDPTICGQRGPLGRIAERLELTDSQKEKVEKLHLKHAEKRIEIKNLLGEKKARLRTLSTAQKVDMDNINELIEEVGALKIKMMKSKASFKQSVRSILSDEQRILFDSHSQRMGKSHRMSKGGGFHHGKNGRGGRGNNSDHRGQNRW